MLGVERGPVTFRVYVIVLLVTFAALSAFKLAGSHLKRLSCWSGGYTQNAWMAYCNSELHGVYDIDAIWFDVERDVAPAVARAKVLTLSDSHMQNALSLGGASGWFSEHGYPMYMLGLPAQESGFGELLLDKFQPHPDVVIFDTSPYFTGGRGKFESGLIVDPEKTRGQALELQGFQTFHQNFCSKFAWVCGRNFSYFRSREDGHWIFPAPSDRFWLARGSVPNDSMQIATSTMPDELTPLYPRYLQAARQITAKLKVRPECIVITHVPATDPMTGLSSYLAASLGVTLIEPQLSNMTTFDGAHLTPESSLRWTQAFLHDLEPVLKNCISNSDKANTN